MLDARQEPHADMGSGSRAANCIPSSTLHLINARPSHESAAPALPTWMMSRLVAPARPTFTVTGSTSADSANDLILAGMVALHRGEGSEISRLGW